MKKTLISTLAAAAIGTAAVATATPASAFVWWVVPAIAGGVIGGAAVGSAVNNPPGYRAEEGTVYVRPTNEPSACHYARERTAGGWRRVEVCD